MKRFITLLLICLCSISCDARTLSAALEYRVRSSLSDVSSFGNVSDNLDYSWPVTISAPTQLYRADRTVGTATAEVLGLVGSLTNSIGETVTFSTVHAIYIQEVSSLGALTVSGLATASIPAGGTFSQTGAMPVASAPTISISATATTTYRIWIVGE